MKLEHYFVDGTKIEANANRYTIVWGKAVVKHKTSEELETVKKLKDKPFKKAVRAFRKNVLPRLQK